MNPQLHPTNPRDAAMVPTSIGSVCLRISQLEHSPDKQYVLTITSVGQPDIHLSLYCRDLSLADERGNGHPVPDSILAKNLTPKD